MPKKKEATKEVAKDKAAIIKTAAEEMLAMLTVEATVEVTDGEEGSFIVLVQTEESGLLIGYHGESLASFQMILGLVVFRELGEWVRVVVEVGDYRARREEQLQAMAESYASQVVATGEPMYLPYLPPIERRIIHLTLQDRTDVVTESEGMGRMRRLVIKPKTS